MQKISFVSSKKLTDINFKLLNMLYFCLPISFLVGNGFTNAIIFLIFIIGVFSFPRKLYLVKNDSIMFIILAFFITLLISTLLDIQENPNNDNFFKSISYFRYFFLFLFTSFFVKIEKFNFKYFIISCLTCTFLLSLDISFQFLSGFNVLGFKAYEFSSIHLAGFIKEKFIAGGYIQKFYIFGLILFPFISKKLEKQKFVLSIFLTVIFFTGIFYSGNRMPLLMFLFSIFLIILLIKNLRFPMIISILLCSVIFFTTMKNNNKLYEHYLSFYSNAIYMQAKGKAFPVIDYLKEYTFKKYPELEKKEKKHFPSEFSKDKSLSKYKIIHFASGHAVVYITAIDLWTDSPIIGSGIKSFRIKCLSKLYLPNRVCQAHPHNFYLELLNDTGLIGTVLFLFAIFFLLKNKFLNFKNFEKKEKLLILCIFIIIASEFFPMRSSGSFFSTRDSSYIFFILGMLHGLKKVKI
tara:strand:- start:41010 stop:42401 length:1392 start_codon:yes stop_codon:yes gene_type:complete